MQYDLKQAKEDIELMDILMSQRKEMLEKYDFIPDDEHEEKLLEIMTEFDNAINVIQNRLNSESLDEFQIEILKKQQEEYKTNIEIVFEYNNIISNIHELTRRVIARVQNTNLIQSSSIISPDDINHSNFKQFIDNLCLQIYKIPLLVALITKDPSDIIIEISNLLDFNSINNEVKKEILQFIEIEKRRIEHNLVLSDKTLIDLIENSTGKNIMHESLVDGRVIENPDGKGYSLVKNGNNDIRRHSYGGGKIVEFSGFERKASDMFIRDFTNSNNEELVFRSFSSLPNKRKAEFIKTVLDNLQLCYEMFQSYYMNDKIEIPTHLTLTNGEVIDYYFYRFNLPHILGINKLIDLPSRTIFALGLNNKQLDENGNVMDILEIILKQKDEIINACGLVKDSSTNIYYELLPWEKIILKTNAFIRGDFFKKTAYITNVSRNSGLFSSSIQKISLTGTQFLKSALNQPLPNSEELNMLRAKNQEMDFIIKGMCYNDKTKMWVPQTNASAMGERIIVNNASRIRTLERYRKALSNTDPGGSGDPGGLIVSVENDKFGEARVYSKQELAQALVDIALTFDDSKQISKNVREVFEQLKSYDSQIGSNKKY